MRNVQQCVVAEKADEVRIILPHGYGKPSKKRVPQYFRIHPGAIRLLISLSGEGEETGKPFVDIRAIRVVLSHLEGWPLNAGWTDEADELEVDMAELGRQMRRFMRAGGHLGELAQQAVKPAVTKGLDKNEAACWEELLRRRLVNIAYPSRE